MAHYDWTVEFQRIYQQTVAAYRAGERKTERLFSPDEVKFLAAHGQTPQELFDFAEDAVTDGSPDYGTALLIAAARRDYFLVVQHGKAPGKPHWRPGDDFPKKSDSIDGIPWLPRIIEKARARLRGELPPDLMYGCGGDRKFLRSNDLPPADFLRFVWSAGEETGKIVEYVKSRTSPAS